MKQEVSNIFALLIFTAALSGCAVNNVKEVLSRSDTQNSYRVPLVYGISGDIGPQEDYPNNRFGLNFLEYDPEEGRGTGSCLGSADKIIVQSEAKKIDSSDNNKVFYRVFMVPPGYYAGSLNREDGLQYFKIESDKPSYLGNFNVSSRVNEQGYKVFNAKLIEGDEINASRVLNNFGVLTKNLKKVEFSPTSGTLGIVFCVL